MLRLVRGIWRPVNYQYKRFKSSKAPHMSCLFIQPPADEEPELTTVEINKMFDVGEYNETDMKESLVKREALMKLLPTDDDDLPPRTMKDSFVTAIIPLKSNLTVREKYVNPDGNLRIGRFLEEMDFFSVYCCQKHILNPKSVGQQSPYSVVTALVDNIYITNDKMKNNENVRLSGHMAFAGKSSMEVCIVVDQKNDNGVYQKCIEAKFVLVARDSMNRGPAIINPLKADTNEEQEFLNIGKIRQQVRKEREEENIFKKPPNEEERKIIHDRFIQKSNISKPIPTNTKMMSDSILKTVFICQPQYRNRNNKIFGGFTMRMAYELALTNTFIYGKKRPRIVNIDDIKFLYPVEIGSIFRVRSHIGYVEGNFVQSVVYAEVVYPKTGEILKTNEFHVTFQVPQEAGEDPVPTLDFETYEEAIHYLNSRRYFKKMMKDYGEFASK
ncbi:Acyl-coenzyme A thioesterase 9, mitochondrial [Orchesella cincta]|uniref:Acyl-coenzyme A thioesterase 9, mitochondrial n=1 Tax=Orchesella cincta TaxID=48709 RepID=A0A1D2NDY1_ORCCI|nr:Acyl-coenzyme A thioesterase 9, mitochondrial [Orchesella cincta]